MSKSEEGILPCSDSLRFNYLYFREEMIPGQLSYRPRLKPSARGGLETVIEKVQGWNKVGFGFRLAPNLYYDHVLYLPPAGLRLLHEGRYLMSGNSVEFTRSDGEKVLGYLQANGHELVVDNQVYTLLS